MRTLRTLLVSALGTSCLTAAQSVLAAAGADHNAPTTPPATTVAEAAAVQASQALSQNPVEKELKRVDTALQSCSESATPRVHAAISLGLLETNLEELLQPLIERLHQSPPPTDEDLTTLLQDSDRKADDFVKGSLAEENAGSDVLRAFRRTDALRLQADFRLRLAVLASSIRSDVLAKDFTARAKNSFNIALDEFGKLPDVKRAVEVPGLLGKMAESQLSIDQFEHLRTPDESSSVALDRMNARLDSFRRRFIPSSAQGNAERGFEADRLDLDLLEAQTFYSLANTHPGQVHGTVAATKTQNQRLDGVLSESRDILPKIDSLNLPIATRTRLRSTALTVLGLDPFYRGPSPRTAERINGLVRDLKSQSPETQSVAEAVAQNIVDHQPDSYAAVALIRRRGEYASQHPNLKMDDQAIAVNARAAFYDQKVQEKLGPAQANLFRLPTYSELVSSPDGSLAMLQQSYFERLDALAKMKERYQKDPKSVDISEIESALQNSDMAWLEMQCLKQATGHSQDNDLVRKTPSGLFHVNLTICRSNRVVAVPGGRGRQPSPAQPRRATLSDVGPVYSEVLKNAVNRDVATELAWTIGPQIVIVGASGGMMALVEGAAARLGAGELMTLVSEALAARGASTGLLALGSSAVRLGAATASSNVSFNVANSLDSFATEGLRTGKWNPHTLKENFAYTSSQTTAGSQVAQIAAAAVATAGIGKLWKISSNLKLTQNVASRLASSDAMLMKSDFWHQTTAGMVASASGSAVGSALDSRTPSVDNFVSSLANPESWLAGIPAVGRILAPPNRLMSPAALSHLSALPLDTTDQACLDPLQRCASTVPPVTAAAATPAR